MLTRFRSQLSYSNVMATIAVFVALGGSSYAALQLPRNSVGATQIKRDAVRQAELRSNSVGSGEIKKATIRPSDLNPTAVTLFKGQKGDQGTPGLAAAKYFVTADPGGGRLRGNATSGGHAPALGTYDFGFAESVSACSFVATIGTADGSEPPQGRISVFDAGGRAGVRTYDTSDNPADRPFHLIVAC